MPDVEMLEFVLEIESKVEFAGLEAAAKAIVLELDAVLEPEIALAKAKIETEPPVESVPELTKDGTAKVPPILS